MDQVRITKLIAFAMAFVVFAGRAIREGHSNDATAAGDAFTKQAHTANLLPTPEDLNG